MKFQTKSKKVNKAWLHGHINDPYVKMAKRDGYRARAAYKLKEIDEEHKLFKPGQVVIDLGAAPGAWSQYLRRRFAPKEAGIGGAAVGKLNGTIISLDLLECEPIEGVQFIQGDFQDESVLQLLESTLAGRPVDVVTVGGIMGKVTALKDQVVTVEISVGTEVQMQKSAITTVLPKGTLKSA